MPMAERYKDEVPEMVEVWEPAGYFKAQMDIWKAECETSNELSGKPTEEELGLIKGALVLTRDEVVELSDPHGHETNKLLRLVQKKLPLEVGNYLHKGNTSSDVLDTSMALQILESLRFMDSEYKLLGEGLSNLALKYKDTLQVARSHGQHAIIQTFGRQALGWFEAIKRAIDRNERAREIISFGKLSGEVGTNVFIEPEFERKALEKLGLKPEIAPTQIIPRDRHLEVLYHNATNARALGKIAHDMHYLCSTDAGELREPFEEGKQGSSSMPHKRNPDVLERIMGLSREIAGQAHIESEAVALLLERDISHSSMERYTFPDSFGNLLYITRLLRGVVDGLEVFPDRMLENINRTYGGIYTGYLLNTLIDRGIYTRTEAYDILKPLGQKAIDEKRFLLEIVKEEPAINEHITDNELEEMFDPAFYVRNIDEAFKRAGLLRKS